MMTIKHNHIIDFLRATNKTVHKVAHEIGVSQMEIYRVIRKRVTPSLSLAKSIALSLGTTIDHLFHFEHEHHHLF